MYQFNTKQYLKKKIKKDKKRKKRINLRIKIQIKNILTYCNLILFNLNVYFFIAKADTIILTKFSYNKKR